MLLIQDPDKYHALYLLIFYFKHYSTIVFLVLNKVSWVIVKPIFILPIICSSVKSNLYFFNISILFIIKKTIVFSNYRFKQGMRESNPHQKFWRLLSYHLTNPLYCKKRHKAFGCTFKTTHNYWLSFHLFCSYHHTLVMPSTY